MPNDKVNDTGNAEVTAITENTEALSATLNAPETPAKPTPETPAKPTGEATNLSETLDAGEDAADSVNADDGEAAKKEEARTAYNKRQEAKSQKELLKIKQELEELKASINTPTVSEDVIAKKVEEAIQAKAQKELYAARNKEADAMFNAQEYAQAADSRAEFIGFMRNDPTIMQIHKIDPVAAVQLADMKFREAKGLSASKVQTAQMNAARSNLVNTPYRQNAAPDIARELSDLASAKMTPEQKRDAALKIIAKI